MDLFSTLAKEKGIPDPPQQQEISSNKYLAQDANDIGVEIVDWDEINQQRHQTIEKKQKIMKKVQGRGL